MKKRSLILIFTVTAILLCLFGLSACVHKSPVLESISVMGETEVYVDEFRYSDYTITAKYSDNSTKTAALTADNLSADDIAKLSAVGTHSLTVSYEGVTCLWTVTLKNHDFTGVTFEDITTTYDGTAKTLAVTGLPAGAEVSYDKETTYTNAGTYKVKATVTLANYNPIELTATLTINKATYDMSGVVFKDKSVIYTGEAYSIEATNLPNGVSVSYFGNNQTQAGEYTVTAKFTGDEVNYNVIPDMTAILKISASDLTGISFIDGEFIYDGQPKYIYITGELPEGVTVTYKNNGKINANSYIVTAEFICTNGNYNNLPDVTATLTINKATYDMSGVVFKDKSVTYTGEAYSIEATNLPNGVSVSYVGNNQTQAGKYTVTAKFVGDEVNYNAIPDMTATLTIEKRELVLAFSGETTLVYNGKIQKTVTVRATNVVGNDSVELTVTYSGEMIEVGEYIVTVTLTEHKNYKLTQNNKVKVTITRSIHKITFRQSGYADVIREVPDLADLTDIPTPQNENGYTVTWNRTEFKSVTQDILVETEKTPIEYDIEYVLNGGVNSAKNPTKYTIESDDITLESPTIERFGSTFAGWYTTNTFTDESKITVIKKGSYGNKTLYAKWLDYRIENSDGFTVDFTQDTPTVLMKVSNSTENIDLNSRFKVSSGCTWALYSDFMGYNKYPLKAMTLAVGNNQAYIIVNHPDGEHFTRYLLNIYRLDIKEYVFRNGFEKYASGTIQEESALNAPEVNPKKDGYSFAGWSVNGVIVSFPYTVFTDTVFVAEYTPIEYTVVFNGNGGTVKTPVRTYTIETGMTFEIPTRDYYDFVGWFDSKTNGAFSGISVGTFGDYEFYAKWTPTVYTITYELNGGSWTADNENPTSYNVETPTFVLQNTVQKAGYTFVGWFTDAAFENQVTSIELGSNGNKKCYAKWEEKLNTLKFNGNGATSGETPEMKIPTDETKTLTANGFVKTGYIFVGWSLTANGEKVYDDKASYKMGAESEYMLYAVWQANENTLKFDGNGATSGETPEMKIPTDETKTLTANGFKRTGYIFVGWSLTANGEKVYDDKASYKMGAESEYMLYAVWYLVPYAITYELNGGTNHKNNPDSFTVLDNLPITLEKPSKTGYTFGGWYLDSKYQQSVQTISELKEYTVYALWVEGTEGLTYSLLDSKYSITDYTGTDTAVVIPAVYNGYPVTGIGSSAFYNCSSLTSVTIPNSVTSIGDSAFSGCTSLTSVYITDIAAWCRISFRDSDANPLYYAKNLYLNNNLVTVLTIPDSVTSIGFRAFSDCTSLTSVTIENGVTSIGNGAFYGCTSLKSITIPDSVTSIGNSAFYDCNSLTSVYITDIAAWCKISFGGYKSYPITGSYAANPLWYAKNLYLNNNLVTALIIPGSVTSIGNGAFQFYSSLTSVTIPNSVRSIGFEAFIGCRSLTNVTIGNSVTSIGSSAFEYCTSLTSVTIGNSVTSIGPSAFHGCSRLIEVKNLSHLNITAGSSDYGYVGYYAKRVYKEGKSYLSTDKDGYIIYDDGTDKILVGYTGTATDLTL
ncbi:MAG: leucine-rich repeat protein, partial [Clostridiales bacterium]|nr:leucine-rich repeat protein [Clostridiales bacterium]